jgi:hypothetical protein
MRKMATLKKLYEQFTICGMEENFTNYCFRYGKIIAEYRNDYTREVEFNIHDTFASVTIENGETTNVKLLMKKKYL